MFKQSPFLHEWVEHQTCDSWTALLEGETSWTYAELDSRAERLALHLSHLGVGLEDRVGLLLPRSANAVVALLAILKVGGAFVPLDPAYPHKRLNHIVLDAGIRVLICTSQSLEGLEVLLSPAICVLKLDRVDISETGERAPRPVLTPEHLAYVIYTSGTTGQPKGVLLTHRGLLPLADAQHAVLGVPPGARVLQLASVAFDAFIFEVVMALRAGGCIVFADHYTLMPGPSLVRLLERARVSHLTITPSALAALPRAELPDLVCLCVAGEKCTPGLIDGWDKGRRLFNLYGPTEATVWATWARCDRGTASNIGVPISTTQTYVLSPSLLPSQDGELYLSGPGLARGYLGRAGLTAVRFLPDPFAVQRGSRMYRTGDRVRIESNGTLDFVGRLDSQLKLRGFRIEPEEIEAALLQITGVRQAVVTEFRDNAVHTLVGYYVAELALTPEAVHTALVQVLPSHLMPGFLVPLTELPCSPQGKLDKAALPPPPRSTAPSNARSLSPMEDLVVEVSSSVLQMHVSPEDDFFRRGGDSLLAMKVVARLSEKLEMEIPAEFLFESRSLAAFAARVDERLHTAGGARVTITRVPPGDPRPPSSAERGVWLAEQLDPGRATYVSALCLAVSGPLEEDLLREALTLTVRRHDVLHSIWFTVEGQPNARVIDEFTVPFELHDLQHLPLADREWTARQRATEATKRPFDLTIGVLFRTVLVRLGPSDHLLVLVVHHIAWDALSAVVFCQDLSLAYRARQMGRDPTWPAPHVQYADYSAYERRQLSDGRFESHHSWWRERLAGLAPLRLASNRERRTGHGRREFCSLGERITEAVRDLCRKHGVTPYVVLLGAAVVLLHRYVGAEDFAVGTLISARSRSELEGVVGLFVHTLPIRVDLSQSPPFVDLLSRLRAAYLDVFIHREIPIDGIISDWRQQVGKPGAELFPLLFAFDNTPVPKLDAPGLRSSAVELDNETAKFDLVLSVREYPGDLRATLVYNTAILDPEGGREFLSAYARVLQQFVDQPQLRPLEVLLDTLREGRLAGSEPTFDEFDFA